MELLIEYTWTVITTILGTKNIIIMIIVYQDPTFYMQLLRNISETC